MNEGGHQALGGLEVVGEKKKSGRTITRMSRYYTSTDD